MPWQKRHEQDEQRRLRHLPPWRSWEVRHLRSEVGATSTHMHDSGLGSLAFLAEKALRDGDPVSTDPVDQLVGALQVTRRIIEHIDDSEWDLPTPCPRWTVRDVVNHLAEGNWRFAALLGVGTPDGKRPSVAGDPVASYRDSSAALTNAYCQPEALSKVITVPFGTVPGAVSLQLRLVEALVHGWDLAQATGQEVTFPDSIAESALSFSQVATAQIPPDRHPFGPPQPVQDTASAIDRLAGYLGRPIPVVGR